MYGDCFKEEIGEMIGKYRVLQCIGSGGFSTVYKVEDMHIGKKFAMKIVKASGAQRDNSEPKLLTQLEHKGLPGLHDVFCVADKICIVMELAKGKTLKEYVASKGKLTVKEGMLLGRELAEILKYLHSRPQPVVHGDLKPQNIMVDETGLSLIDFGGAFLQYDVRDVFFGTPGYAAPEMKEGEVFTQSDVYAFGMVLLFMLTGREPYLFSPQHIRKSMKKYGIPGKIRKITERCIKEAYFERYQSGMELQEALLKSEGDVLRRFSANTYKTAILECECSIFVSQGL